MRPTSCTCGSRGTPATVVQRDLGTPPGVHELFARSGESPITFSTLLPLFQGVSVNTAGFLLAALKHPGLVQQIPDRPRHYERLEAKAFFSEIEGLMVPPHPQDHQGCEASDSKAAADRSAKS